MNISTGDMVWIIAVDKHGQSGIVHCIVDNKVFGLNSVFYILSAKDNPSWNGDLTFSCEEESIYSSLSRVLSAFEFLSTFD
jgi:hypothetical protein